MKFVKISASLNQGITELFEDITRDIIYKMNDEDLISRSRSIKLGYENSAMFKADEEFVKNSNYNDNNCDEKKGFLRNRSGNYQDTQQAKEFNKSHDNKDCSLDEYKDKKNNHNNKYFSSNFSAGCCKII